MEFGVGIARKGWLEASDVINALSADENKRRATIAEKVMKAKSVTKKSPSARRRKWRRRSAKMVAKTVVRASHEKRQECRTRNRRRKRPRSRICANGGRATSGAKGARGGVLPPALGQYPDAHCALDHKNPYQLLVATILSAQCTDKRVNMVTPELFRHYPDAMRSPDAEPETLENEIKSTGFFRNKTKSLLGMARALVERHGGKVPDTMEELTKLPGVGRKTANVVLGNAFGKNVGIVVDTHVTRLATGSASRARPMP